MSQGDDGGGDAECLLGHDDPEDCHHTNGGGCTTVEMEEDTVITMRTGADTTARAATETCSGAGGPGTMQDHTRCPICFDPIANDLID